MPGKAKTKSPASSGAAGRRRVRLNAQGAAARKPKDEPLHPAFDLPGVDISPETLLVLSNVIATRRKIHMYPETAFTETGTQKLVMDALADMHLKPAPVAKTGVTATIGGESSGGKTLMLRADMDALPITEENEVDYKSRNVGKMHACGHDAHTAMLLGAARLFIANPPRRGRVKLAFQPAEEGGGGAAVMLKEGILERPKVDAALGFHVWNIMPVGKVGVIPGPCMAAVDEFEITVTGAGGHAAYPHMCIDPIVIASHIVVALQTVVARNLSPFDNAVLTVGMIQGGTAFNIIPQEARLKGTVRTFDKEVRNRVPHLMKSIVESTAKAYGGSAVLDLVHVIPATVNNKEMAAMVTEVAKEVVGAKNVLVTNPSMGGEDMSLFLEAVPGCYAFLGSMNAKKGLDRPHHHPRFNIDENVLAIGVELITRATRKYLEG